MNKAKYKKQIENNKIYFNSLNLTNNMHLQQDYLADRPTINLSSYELIIPYLCFCNKNNNIIRYKIGVKQLEYEMEICHIINQINQIEKLKENIFDKNQLKMFNKLYNLDHEKLNRRKLITINDK